MSDKESEDRTWMLMWALAITGAAALVLEAVFDGGAAIL